MDIKNLYLRLKEAYTEENLNNITSNIIESFKNKEYDYLRGIIKIIKEFIDLKEEKINKSFSKLIILYHPDKLNYYKNEIEKYYKTGETEKLNQFSHIFFILDVDTGVISNTIDLTESDYSPQYEWDYNEKGYNYFSDTDEDNFKQEIDNYTDYENDNSFYTAVKRKIYGSQEIDLPYYLLEDLEEIEMAEYEIDNLQGIEACKYVISLDLSGNNLTDITDIGNLKRLEELYLANNQIGFIDAVIYLKNLRIIDISYNQIDDLSSLFYLDKLEYINITGNNIPKNQIEQLRNKDIIVVS